LQQIINIKNVPPAPSSEPVIPSFLINSQPASTDSSSYSSLTSSTSFSSSLPSHSVAPVPPPRPLIQNLALQTSGGSVPVPSPRNSLSLDAPASNLFVLIKI